MKQCAVKGAGATPVHRPDTGSLDPRSGFLGQPLQRRLRIGRRTINLMLTVGSQGLYEWLVTDQQFDLLKVCPEVVLGKYVAITSIDSGVLVPTEEEMTAGWESRLKIAYSPKIQNVLGLPRAGWDEWYIFNTPTDLGTSHLAENIFEVPQDHGHVSVLVNYYFALDPPERAKTSPLCFGRN